MSYIRIGHELLWFEDNSHEYIFPHCDDYIEDYGTGFEHTPSLLEVVGNIVWRETNSFEFASKVVVALAYKTGVQNKLRKKPHFLEEFEKERGCDYNAQIEKWSKFFENRHKTYSDLSDFDHLDTFNEKDLFDVGMNIDNMIDRAKAVVESVLSTMDLPCKINVKPSYYTWRSVGGEYEFGVDLTYDKIFTNNLEQEDREMKKIEDAIHSSGVLRPLEIIVGKIEVCCYFPFESLIKQEDKKNNSSDK